LPDDYLTEQGQIDTKKKQSVLYKRYGESKAKEDQFANDVDQWEAGQAKHSNFNTSAMNKIGPLHAVVITCV
jgi:pre-mRNA-splicing factor ATP-dependent RNA helicase DHX16